MTNKDKTLFKNPKKINDYNKFLSSLDKRFLNNINDDSKINGDSNINNDSNINYDSNINNDSKKNNLEEEMKKIIDKIIQNLDNDFSINNYSSINFTGQSQNDIIMSKKTIHNPNEYRDIKKYDTYSEKKNKKINISHLFNKYCNNDREKLNHYEIKRMSKNSDPIIEIKETIHIETEINNIGDMLKLIDTYKAEPHIKYNINMKLLHNIKEPLEELNNMIGMKDLKNNIVDQILYFVQELHKNKNSVGDFMHTVIYGPPGTGKTEIAKIMGKIYGNLGILSQGTFKKVVRSDLIAGYLGQTALKTKDVIKESIGGVLFIDEAYALGNTEKRDSFAKECIDTLCEALSEHKDNLMVIIAGYENELKECFFNYNQGLDSRFTWRFKTDDYKFEDLYNIFIKKVKDIGWELHENSNITKEWFKENKDYFKFYGRDIETILAKTKIAHSKRVFCKPDSEKRKIILLDLENGFKIYLNNDNIKKGKDEIEFKKYLHNSLYS